MSDKYKIVHVDEPYFVTFTISDWVKVLADDSLKMILIESISYCQINKCLQVNGYCIMANHVHMIIEATGDESISGILLDLKTFTSETISIVKNSILKK
jgi:putative transposase